MDGERPLTASHAREMSKAQAQIGFNGEKDLTPHSLRSGGATAAANKGVSGRLIMKHGRCSSERTTNGYILDSLENRLLVSQILGL